MWVTRCVNLSITGWKYEPVLKGAFQLTSCEHAMIWNWDELGMWNVGSLHQCLQQEHRALRAA